jgi:hypothetical protein
VEVAASKLIPFPFNFLIPKSFSVFNAELFFACYVWLSLAKRPDEKVKKAWCK